MVMKILFVLVAFLSCTTLQDNKVSRVVDGDTIQLLNGKMVRLRGCDSPEILQKYGLEAKEFTERFVVDRRITLVEFGTDKYGRTIAEVYVGGKNLSYALVKAGLAWVYPKYGSGELLRAQDSARRVKIGLWAQNGAQPPFVWRKNH